MKKAFTLAEVLISLLIIGIIAALTIPSVISNYQQQEYKTGLKKAVSVLNDAIQTNIAQDGETPYDFADGNIADYLMRHMSILKTASFGGNFAFYTTDGMRFENDVNGYKEGLKLHSNADASYHCDTQHINWCSTEIRYFRNRFCGSYGLENNNNNTINPPCIIMVDINGDRRPNPKISSTYFPPTYWANGDIMSSEYTIYDNKYIYPSPNDKKLSDIFNIMITDEKAIPYGVVAQRAMYSK